MKKKYLIATMITLMIAGGITANILASSTIPGTASDPLVSKGYVDDKFNELTNLIKTMGTNGGSSTSIVDEDKLLGDVMEQLEIYYADVLGGGSLKYVPVSAKAGQIILGEEGTEIILRSGTAKGYINGENGIVNASTGAEIFNNDNIKINNLLIVPRGDGRGVSVMTDAWFIIKGEYKIIN